MAAGHNSAPWPSGFKRALQQLTSAVKPILLGAVIIAVEQEQYVTRSETRPHKPNAGNGSDEPHSAGVKEEIDPPPPETPYRDVLPASDDIGTLEYYYD